MSTEDHDFRAYDKEEKILLAEMYEVQDKMEKLLDKGKDDPHYMLMDELIQRLETYLSNINQQLI